MTIIDSLTDIWGSFGRHDDLKQLKCHSIHDDCNLFKMSFFQVQTPFWVITQNASRLKPPTRHCDVSVFFLGEEGSAEWKSCLLLGSTRQSVQARSASGQTIKTFSAHAKTILSSPSRHSKNRLSFKTDCVITEMKSGLIRIQVAAARGPTKTKRRRGNAEWR